MSAPSGFLKVSPSDLTYQWKDCKRCFYLKVVRKISKPWSPMPGIFNKIDGAMKGYFDGTPTSKLAKQLGVEIPEGTIRRGQENVASGEVVAQGNPTGLCISGKLDSRVMFKDGTFGIIDFKTSAIDAGKASIYAPQLRAYAYCMENPPGKRTGVTVSLLALLGFEPGKFGHAKDGNFGLNGKGTWAPVERGREEFEMFMAEVASVLANPEPPPAGLSCAMCGYRETARASGL